MATPPQGNSPGVDALVIGLTLLVMGGLVWALVKIKGRERIRAASRALGPYQTALARMDAEIARQGAAFDPGPDVDAEFWTYSGLLLWFEQQHHKFTLPANCALVLLRELHRHNLRHGMFAKGGLWVPVVSWVTLLQQRRRIARQVANTDEGKRRL